MFLSEFKEKSQTEKVAKVIVQSDQPSISSVNPTKISNNPVKKCTMGEAALVEEQEHSSFSDNEIEFQSARLSELHWPPPTIRIPKRRRKEEDEKDGDYVPSEDQSCGGSGAVFINQ